MSRRGHFVNGSYHFGARNIVSLDTHLHAPLQVKHQTRIQGIPSNVFPCQGSFRWSPPYPAHGGWSPVTAPSEQQFERGRVQEIMGASVNLQVVDDS